MGWNSWNLLGSRVDDVTIREIAEALVSTGLKDCGYEYVVIDDCWSERRRDVDGGLVADPTRFPHGIASLADHVHALGLKLGIYSDAADTTCAGHPGSLGFEERDAVQWASWGIDFLKYDYCAAPDSQAVARDRYTAMAKALAATGREFLYSICEWGGRAPQLWGGDAGGHMWRVTPDVMDSWVDIRINDADPPWTAIGIDRAIDIAADLADYGGPAGWNDLDMLVVGLRGGGHISGGGLSFLEYQTHFSMWSIACSPLMVGCDVRAMDDETRSLLTNREVIAVNQDSMGVPAKRVRQRAGCEVWKKPLHDGSVAVALLNRGSSAASIPLVASDIGLLDDVKQVRDVWAGIDLGEFYRETSYRVEAHQTLLLRIALG
jgi:alpha-galactosidase